MGEPLEEEQDISIIVKEKEGIFYLVVPELGLLVKGDDVSRLYQEINDQKKAVLREYQDLGIASQIQPVSKSNEESILAELSKFFFKCAMVTVLIVSVFFVTVTFTFSRAIDVVSSVEFMHVGSGLIDKLENMPPEKKEQYQRWIRKIVSAIKPFADELKPLLAIPLEHDNHGGLRPVAKQSPHAPTPSDEPTDSPDS